MQRQRENILSSGDLIVLVRCEPANQFMSKTPWALHPGGMKEFILHTVIGCNYNVTTVTVFHLR